MRKHWRTGAAVLGLILLMKGRAAYPLEGETVSLRSLELLRLDCSRDIGARDITLFGNGTVRVRYGLEPDRSMRLAELDPDSLIAYQRRLDLIDLSEVPAQRPGVGGDWIETCRLVLRWPAGTERAYEFQELDTLPLGLSQVLAIVSELEESVGPAEESALPPGYVPQPGDVLRRWDGALFEVVDRTLDGHGVELRGLDIPLTIYVVEDLLRRQFRELVDDERSWSGPGRDR